MTDSRDLAALLDHAESVGDEPLAALLRGRVRAAGPAGGPIPGRAAYRELVARLGLSPSRDQYDRAR